MKYSMHWPHGVVNTLTIHKGFYLAETPGGTMLMRPDLDKTVLYNQESCTEEKYQPIGPMEETFNFKEKATYNGKECTKFYNNESNPDDAWFVDDDNNILAYWEKEDEVEGYVECKDYDFGPFAAETFVVPKSYSCTDEAFYEPPSPDVFGECTDASFLNSLALPLQIVLLAVLMKTLL